MPAAPVSAAIAVNRRMSRREPEAAAARSRRDPSFVSLAAAPRPARSARRGSGQDVPHPRRGPVLGPGEDRPDGEAEAGRPPVRRGGGPHPADQVPDRAEPGMHEVGDVIALRDRAEQHAVRQGGIGRVESRVRHERDASERPPAPHLDEAVGVALERGAP